MLHSIFTKLLFWTGILVVIIALFMALANGFWYKKTLTKEVDIKAIETLEELASDRQLQNSLTAGDDAQILQIVSRKLNLENILYIAVYDTEKERIYTGQKLIPESFLTDPIIYEIDNPLVNTFSEHDQDFRDISLPIIASSDDTESEDDFLFGDAIATEDSISQIQNSEWDSTRDVIGYIRIGVSLKDVYTKFHRNNQINLILTLIAVVIGTIFSITVSLNLTSPIKKLRDATEKITRGDFDYTKSIIESNDEIGELADSFNRMTKELNMIDELSNDLNKQPDLKSLANSLLWFIVGVLDFDQTFIYIKDKNTFKFMGSTGKWPKEKIEILKGFSGEWLCENWETCSFIEGLLANVAQEQQYINLKRENEAVEEYMKSIGQYGVSFLGTPTRIIPIIVNQETIGILCVSNGISKIPFTEEQKRLLIPVVREAGSQIVNNKLKSTLIEQERLQSELDIATRIQTALIPPLPQFDGYDVAADMIPAEEVGGDYYDFIMGKDGHFWVSIGDVTSHGLTPGLIMMMAQSSINAIVSHRPDISPKLLVAHLNEVLHSNIRQRLKVEEHMTISVLSANGDGKFTYAGRHEDIILYRSKAKECERIETKGFWVGILPDIHPMIIEEEFTMNDEDVMILYTDGVIEAKNEYGEQFDMDRLEDVITKCAHLSALEIKQTIINTIEEWMDYQADDITLVVIKKSRK